jgi:hypothetical protein
VCWTENKYVVSVNYATLSAWLITELNFCMERIGDCMLIRALGAAVSFGKLNTQSEGFVRSGALEKTVEVISQNSTLKQRSIAASVQASRHAASIGPTPLDGTDCKCGVYFVRAKTKQNGTKITWKKSGHV